MAGNTDTRTVEIILKGQQATASIKEMGAAAAVMKAQLDKMSQDDPGREKLQRDYAEMSQRYKEANTAARTLVKTTEELAAEQAAANAEAVRIVVNGKKVSATYNEMDAAAKQLEKDIKDLTPGTAEFIKKSKELQEVKGRMDEVDKSIKGTEKSTWLAKLGLDGITSASGLMKAGFQAAMAALLPLLAIEKIWEMVQAFVGLVNEVDEVKSAVTTATGAQGEALDGLTVRVRALSKTFGDEYGDVLKAADVLAKQMGVSHEQAFDLIEKGYLAGANRSGEFLDNIKEYAVQYKAAGASAEEFITSVTQAELGGVFSDKGADTVKEFGLRIREQTTATRDALDGAFGQDFTNRIFAGINSGKMTVVQALREVSAAMNDTTVPASKLQTVVADVFGGPGEDAGTTYLQSLYKVGDGIDSLIDRTNMYTQMQQEQLAANKLLAQAEEDLTLSFAGSGTQLENLWAITKAYVYNGITGFINGMEQLRAAVMGSISYLGSWAVTVGKVFTMLKDRDFSGARQAFATAGKDAADAYTTAFNKSIAEGKNQQLAALAADKTKEGKPPVPSDVKTGGSSRQDDEKAEKEREAARKKAHDKELAEQKKHLAELKKAREDAEKAQLTAQQSLEDLRVAAVKNKYEREIQEISLQTDRKMAALQGDDEQIMAQWELLEQQRQERIAAVRQKQKEDEQKLKQEDLARQVEQEQADEEQQAAQLELAFTNGLLAEQAYQDALYELKRVSMENQLALVKQMKGEESVEYKRLNAQILLNEAARIKKEKEQKEDLRLFETRLAQAGAGLLKEGLALVEDNLNKKSAAYQLFKMLRKGAELAEVGMGVIAETQANALNAARNPLNAVPGGSALVATQLAIQNGFAIARGVAAGIKIAAFKSGGNTMRPGEVFGVGQLAGLLSGASGGSFAGGGPVGKATIGLIGEAGPELVIPNWLYSDPKQADLMGFLEAQIASRGNAFAAGGSTVPGTSAVSSGGSDSIGDLMAQLVRVLGQLDGRLEGVEHWARNLEVSLDLVKTKRGLEVVEKTQNGGGIR
ncbi:phage tail tape measure protein [Hymenobacter pini]|uniref:phage tail tape measure protein n=1 Tax=Hymenobacter pini TaxID=2880879 RepID=UPI001CF3924A|nr:phage tail tape measure protein [Hymenobacter pini]MCA8830193.1 hypothetical protein [Hymenobacter pini]